MTQVSVKNVTGWINCDVKMTNGKGETQSMTLETVLKDFDKNRPVFVEGRLGLNQILRVNLIDRSVKGLKFNYPGVSWSTLAPCSAMILIRRRIASMELPMPYLKPLPVRLYSAPHWVRADQIDRSCLIFVPHGWHAEEPKATLVDALPYRDDEIWTSYAEIVRTMPFRSCKVAAGNAAFDGMRERDGNWMLPLVSDVGKLGQLVELTTKDPGGIYCDGVLARTEVAVARCQHIK